MNKTISGIINKEKAPHVDFTTAIKLFVLDAVLLVLPVLCWIIHRIRSLSPSQVGMGSKGQS